MTRGGKRKGAGAPNKKPTSIINFRLETEAANELKKKYGRGLARMFREWAISLLKDKEV
jgi:hypothetical protein